MAIKRHRGPDLRLKMKLLCNLSQKKLGMQSRTTPLTWPISVTLRLHLPNYLHKDFKAPMALSYDLKKNHADLRRNVKFDEDNMGLYMDLQLDQEGHWKRVKPDQAKKA